MTLNENWTDGIQGDITVLIIIRKEKAVIDSEGEGCRLRCVLQPG